MMEIRMFVIQAFLFAIGVSFCSGFVVPQPGTKTRHPWSKTLPFPTSTTSLDLLNRFRKKDKTDPADNEARNDVEDEGMEESSEAESNSKTPFFARFGGKKQNDQNGVNDDDTTKTTLEKTEPLSPAEQAKALKAQAELMRLEAAKMDAKLRLEKIERLEQKLEVAKRKGENDEGLQKELQDLTEQLTGKPTAAPEQPKPMTPKQQEIEQTVTTATDESSTPIEFQGILSEKDGLSPFNQTVFNEQLERFKRAPNFMKKAIANTVAVDFDTVEDINATEVAMRFERQERKDYGWMDVPKPVFSESTIQEMEERINNANDFLLQGFVKQFKNAAEGNKTALAIMVLEDLYYDEMLNKEMAERNFGLSYNMTDQWQRIFSGQDGGLGSPEYQRPAIVFPKSCRKEGQTPTEEQVEVLTNQILPKASFMPSSKPERVEGGYVIRGVNRQKDKSGDVLVNAIDDELVKSSVNNKLSVFYIKDFTVFTREEQDLMEDDPILFVTGPDVSRERRPILYGIASAFGLATTWYLSVYPFLFNSELVKRVEEQIELANSGMDYNLDWLTDFASQIFFTFMSVQLAHELGHRVAAGFYDLNVTAPIFVPSLITGMTSTVTSLKDPPKNHKAMFDFSIAGPLSGMLVSIGALILGLKMTLVTTPDAFASFPALPLEVLRQSTLGGGIIEFMLGNGALSIPDGAEGTAAIADMKIPLHPVAIAGYIGLFVNAISLLPVGTTDGGRISMTLFGRSIKLFVGQLSLLALLLFGLAGSDLFLFYFSFVILFQSGNEIPSRNEVDDVDFGRVLLATFSGVLMLLTLIPFS